MRAVRKRDHHALHFLEIFMADQNTQADNAPSFNMQRVYLKDLSLEMPNAPSIFLEQEAPAVEVSINIGGQALAETVFESTVTVTVTTRIKQGAYSGIVAGEFDAVLRTQPDGTRKFWVRYIGDES